MSLGNKVNLVVCQKSKIDDWIEHFTEYYDIRVFDLTSKKKDDKRKANAIMFNIKYGTNIPCILVINYELAWRRKELLNLSDFTLMLDESSLIQNIKAKQSKFIMKLNPANVILLSGTPVSGKYENLVTQANLLGWNISDALYQSQYVNYKLIEDSGFIHKVVDKSNPYKNVERLKRKLREYGAVFKKTEEVIELPEQQFIDIRVNNTKDYATFKKNKIVEVDDVELIGDTILVEILYLRQLAGMYNTNKYAAFEDLINSTNDRLIVFYNFNYELHKMQELTTKPISIVNGEVKDLSNYENESNSITFVQFQAGAKGLNLQKANKMIYFSPTQKVEDYMQSQKRIHRIGQNKPCFYYRLITSNSIEEKIYKALENGIDYTNNLFI